MSATRLMSAFLRTLNWKKSILICVDLFYQVNALKSNKLVLRYNWKGKISKGSWNDKVYHFTHVFGNVA